MLALLAASPGFYAPVATGGSRSTVAMQSRREFIDQDRRGRSPGIQNNFYDMPTSDFKRPIGMSGNVVPTNYVSERYEDRGDRYYGGDYNYELSDQFDRTSRRMNSAAASARDASMRARERYYGDRGYGDRGYGDRGFDDRAYGESGFGSYGGYGGYSDRGYGDRGYYGSRGYSDRGYYNSGRRDRRYSDRGYGYSRGYGSAMDSALDFTANAGLFAFLCAIFAAPIIPNSSSLASFIGCVLVFSGGVFAVSGALPTGRVLNTEGVHSFCRHPGYAGLIVSCIGLGFFSGSTQQLLSRMLFTGGLSLLLWYKADRDEAILEDQYGPAYFDWAYGVPRFFPLPPGSGQGRRRRR